MQVTADVFWYIVGIIFTSGLAFSVGFMKGCDYTHKEVQKGLLKAIAERQQDVIRFTDPS